MRGRKGLILVCAFLVGLLLWGTSPIQAQGTTSDVNQNQGSEKRITTADREAAAANARAAGLDVQAAADAAVLTPGATPDYFGATPNFANSPLPTVNNAAAVTTTFYFAEGTCRPNFDAYICIQNPGVDNADVTITYMKGDGTTDSEQLVVPKNSRSTVLPKSKLGTGDDVAHDFSAKVECTNGKQIIAERPMYFNYNGVWTGGSDAMGATAPAPILYFAEGTCRPNFDPYICIQNPGSTDADVTITYMKGDGTTDSEQLTVAKNSRFTVTPRSKLGTGDDVAHDFSAKVECTNGQQIIAERPMYFNYNGVWTGGSDAMGATAPATAVYFAEGTCRPNFDPYLCIQNPSSADADVQITYMLGDGTIATDLLTVASNSRSTITPRTKLGTGDDVAHDFSAKVECTNGQQIIAERPMYFNYNGVWTGGHDAVGAAELASTFYFAEGTCRPNFDPYLCIENPGTENAEVTITYMKGDGTTDSEMLTVLKNSRSTITPRTKLGTGDDVAHDFSAKVECTNGQQILAERPMYFNYNGVWTGGHDAVGLPLSLSVNVVPGTGIRKFVDSLPGVGPANANDLGQYIPLAVPDKTTYPGSDYYEIELGQYTEQLHSDLPPTTLRGYRQTNSSNPTVTRFSYMGPLIVAQKDRPVRVKFTNSLPTGTGGDLFLPVDPSVMGAGMGPLGTNVTPGYPVDYTQNRAAVHLHGGNTPWISDGTMHQWITPAGETTDYPKGVSVQNVPDMPDPGDGSQTFYYTNQQSARLLFYHDHAYGITRLNVYAGEAAPYIISDSTEQGLINSKMIPADQVPLVIQDKAFVPDDAQLAAQDPTWDKAKWGGQGNFWFPHVYMPNQNPYDATGANAMGRLDYGPWFWPPFTGLENPPVDNPYYDPVNAPWEPPKIPGTPNPSIIPEAFMDTPIVNGTAYPYMKVGPKAYRFRILNASDDRYLNLQVYFAKSNDNMWDSSGGMVDPNAGEVNMVAAVPGSGLPATWPTDGRDGGVPDPTAVGPNIIQIGNESGFLPGVAELPNTPIGYEYNRRNIVVLNVSSKTLFLGPAERADIIVDFSNVPDGSKLILYNDAPAPVPGFDARYDYYTGDPDQTDTGGAPSTVAGYGPNTRTIMQFQVDKSAKGGMSGFNLNNLKAALPTAYASAQRAPIVPQAAYNTAYGANYPSDAFAKIEDTSMSFFNGPLSAIDVTNGGSGYSSAPTVSIAGGGGTGAVATAEVSGVSAVTLTNGGSGYTSPPTVDFTGGGGSGAAATAQISGVTDIAVTNGGQGYSIAPDVTISGGGGTGATAVAVVDNGSVTAVNVTNGGSDYATAPTITFTGGGGTGVGATATATIDVGAVTGVIVTDSGSGYTTAPGVSFTGGGGTNAAADATIQPGMVTGILLTNQGSGYTSAPTVSLSGGGGSGATAVAAGATIEFQPKALVEDFDANYGRMNAMLGVEVPHTSANIQTTIPYYDTDPPTEIIKNSDSATPIGSLADGTQIWKITHNGVDTHAIHWHMFDVQLINRVGWDGMITPPDANELGWKETIRMNPLEDVIVALRPIIPSGLPFDVRNSIRPLDPTMPIGSTTGFHNVDPTGAPAAVTNELVNYGWEHMWHCHLLGHEENIMMRMECIAVNPVDPSDLVATPGASDITLNWNDNSANETNWTILRATDAAGPWTTVAQIDSTTGPQTGTATYTDTTVLPPGTYYYRVIANNIVGYTQTYTAPAVGYPNVSADSGPADAPPVTI